MISRVDRKCDHAHDQANFQLVHLHLLQYTLADNPEYDQNLFNANVRGLPNYTKNIEDVCYFRGAETIRVDFILTYVLLIHILQ